MSCKKNQGVTKDMDGLSNPKTSQKIFERISADISGLNFSNTLTEDISTSENLFNYDYFYNGAGVGVEDLNNDGLLDIFFCGNQVNNKLYLNKGDFKFEDITKSSGIDVAKNWSNGVTFVDINNDKWMDIYVSQGGPFERLQRKNLLYVNQQDGTFLEKAKEYGLDDMGISTQSAFFDYDKDGDLDCVVMNESELYGVDPINLKKLTDENSELKYFSSTHFYRNDNGKFKDVTKESGIELPIFGLGLSVADINDDGWLDFYIASDYYIPDVLFINNKNGTFSNQIKKYTNHISFYGMGMDIADINNDSMQDIFVLDMAANDHIRSKTLMASMNTKKFDYLVNKAGFHSQYMYNSLQLNMGGNKFSNISQATQMANTDWSWSVLMSDFDQDEDKDVFITNGYRRYALDNDLQQKVYAAKIKYKNNVPLDVKKNLYEAMPSEKLPNVLYQNNTKLKLKESSKEWGLADFSFSNGAALGDLDNDGDLDLIVNNIDENCFLYQNKTVENNLGNYVKVIAQGRLSESYPKIKISYGEKSQFIEIRRVRGYRSSQQNIAHFGMGNVDKIDTIRVLWPSGLYEERYNLSTNTTIEFKEESATKPLKIKNKLKKLFGDIDPSDYGISYVQKENTYDDFEKEILLPYKQSNLGPHISKGDVNGDNLEDFYIGGASGQEGTLYVQDTSGKFSIKTSSVFESDKVYEDMMSVFFDFDNDSDLDLYVVSGGNEFEQNSSLYSDRLYLNNGQGEFTKLKSKALEYYPQSGRAVSIIDFDKDGDKDILVGNRIIPKNYPRHAPSILYENKNGTLKNVTNEKANELVNFGIVNDIITTDFNNDGWDDFIAVGEWSKVGFFKNDSGNFSLIPKNETGINDKGWWFSINETDINNDGLPDYVVGNIGLNLKFKASEKKPFKIYANDFDNNGTMDIVLSKKYNGDYVPVRGRECSSQQMPFIKNKFKSYNEFANAKLIDIYGDGLDTAYENEATTFESILLINKGNNKFEKRILPIEAQFFPILESLSYDVNKDGFEDIIVGGNIYGTEVETPRLDAFSGLVLLSNSSDSYEPITFLESGLIFEGEVKDLEIIDVKNKAILITAKNNDSINIKSIN
ncbi:VCBS repeat-containing protein [uncultured Croceitalea sp.]|uniref:VCBS repeat-containing protein n=1 Tax=uncultured Croceitalea sp. TaxID=1798908 RepID=UPI0033061B7B